MTSLCSDFRPHSSSQNKTVPSCRTTETIQSALPRTENSGGEEALPVCREKLSRRFSEAHSSTSILSAPVPDMFHSSSFRSRNPASALKRGSPAPQAPKSYKGYNMTISKVFQTKLGPAADRLNFSKFTTRRHQAAARADQASYINFDRKLLPDLGGFGKVNRLAVILVRESESKILSIAKTNEAIV